MQLTTARRNPVATIVFTETGKFIRYNLNLIWLYTCTAKYFHWVIFFKIIKTKFKKILFVCRKFLLENVICMGVRTQFFFKLRQWGCYSNVFSLSSEPQTAIYCVIKARKSFEIYFFRPRALRFCPFCRREWVVRLVVDGRQLGPAGAGGGGAGKGD